jgi:hypothetical protein
MKRRLILAGVIFIGGCSAIYSDPPATDSSGNSVSTIIPNKSIALSKSLSIPVEGLVLGAVVYLVVDPLSPNWQIEEARIGEQRYRILLRKKRFTTGGDGESAQIFRRRAEQIARDAGRTGYTVLEFAEGVESNVPIAQRVSWGVIEIR